MSELSRKIREARKRRGFSQLEFANVIGVTQSTVSKWESGAQRPDVTAAVKIAAWAGEDVVEFFLNENEHPYRTPEWGSSINVVGAVETGRWVESIKWEKNDHFQVQIPTLPEWDEFDIEGYLVKDEFIADLYPIGSIVFCKKLNKGVEIGNFDRVLVQRKNKNGLYELTLRVFSNYKGTVISLMSKSRNPDPKQSFSYLPLRLEQDTVELVIIGVVIASFALEPERSPDPLPGFRY